MYSSGHCLWLVSAWYIFACGYIGRSLKSIGNVMKRKCTNIEFLHAAKYCISSNRSLLVPQILYLYLIFKFKAKPKHAVCMRKHCLKVMALPQWHVFLVWLRGNHRLCIRPTQYTSMLMWLVCPHACWLLALNSICLFIICVHYSVWYFSHDNFCMYNICMHNICIHNMYMHCSNCLLW